MELWGWSKSHLDESSSSPWEEEARVGEEDAGDAEGEGEKNGRRRK